MDPTIATGTAATTGPVHFLNIENIFYLLYQLLAGGHASGGVTTGFNFDWIAVLFTGVWVGITIFAYAITLGFLALLIYASMRMYQSRDEDALRYATIEDAHAAEDVTEHHRWTHVRELIESPHDSDWRQAILEADIILDDMLTRLGYVGNSIGDKLKTANVNTFHTLNDAWEAHKVRNDIAHQGSTFVLTDHIAYRTILQYENVFKEHGEI